MMHRRSFFAALGAGVAATALAAASAQAAPLVDLAAVEPTTETPAAGAPVEMRGRVRRRTRRVVRRSRRRARRVVRRARRRS